MVFVELPPAMEVLVTSGLVNGATSGPVLTGNGPCREEQPARLHLLTWPQKRMFRA